MFKTFTGKFFAIYALITFVTFLLLFGVFSQILTDHFVSSQYRAMLKECETIKVFYAQSSDPNSETKISATDFEEKIDTIGYHTGTRILLVDLNSIVVNDTQATSDLLGTIIDHDVVKRSLAGETISYIGSLKPYEKETVIVTATPVIQEGTFIASVIMYAPYPSVKKDITYVYNLTLICLLIIMFVTFVSTYVFSRSMTLTFKAFNNTAKEIASGNFSARIEDNLFSNEVSELADSMNYMAEELEKLEDLRKDFIANISHDFRSPLTSIRGYVQAVMDGTIPPEKYDKYLNVVLSETDRLTKLTNDILLLSKMENKVLVPEREDFDLHEMIRNVLLQFEQKIVSKGIQLTLLMDQEDISVNADYNQINRTITNLLDNAIKFCNANDEIIVETSIAGEKVLVSVKDTGPGISEEDIKHIWTRFHKADRSRGMDKKGVGLGLSIVREIMKAHGETIEVYSQLGKGTSFVLTLQLSDKP